MSYTLIEPCSGSAALSFYLCGARRALVPYQGNKWRFRHDIAEHAQALGFKGHPERVLLTDPGPWGCTLGVVFDPQLRLELIEALRGMSTIDPSTTFARLNYAYTSEEPVVFASEHLFLQRLAFSGKAVGCRGGVWRSPGFNPTSAYGTAATGKFGAVQPMIPSLIRTLETYNEHLVPCEVSALQQRAPMPTVDYDGTRHLVYIDPPYSDSTRYPDGSMTTNHVIELAQAWARTGAAVLVSEQRGLEIPGWERFMLHRGRQDTSKFRGQQTEWITWFMGTSRGT